MTVNFEKVAEHSGVSTEIFSIVILENNYLVLTEKKVY